jgi:hypothetical protein
MKSTRKLLCTVAVLAVSVVVGAPAHAVNVFTVGVSNGTGPGGDPGIPTDQVIIDDYDATVLASNGVPATSYINLPTGVGEVDAGPVALYNATTGIAAFPYNSIPNSLGTNNFEALQPGGTATFEFNSEPVSSFSAYLGSIDQYNSILILGAGGTPIETITGTQLLLSDYGDQTAAITNRRLYINGLTSADTGIEFETSGIAFEFDNVAVGLNGANPGPNTPFVIPAAPEPASWAMMIMGVFGAGGALRFARRNHTVAN